LGRFRQAADREKEIGQIYLQEFHDLGKACDSFVQAGDWYAQEDAAAYVPPPLAAIPNLIARTERPMLAIRMPQTYWPTLGSTPKLLHVTNMSPIIHSLLH
jgi:hypothetical protein